MHAQHAIMQAQHAIMQAQHAIMHAQHAIMHAQHAVMHAQHAIMQAQHANIHAQHAIMQAQHDMHTQHANCTCSMPTCIHNMLTRQYACTTCMCNNQHTQPKNQSSWISPCTKGFWRRL